MPWDTRTTVAEIRGHLNNLKAVIEEQIAHFEKESLITIEGIRLYTDKDGEKRIHLSIGL